MKIHNTASLPGRTIIFRNQFWKVEGFYDDGDLKMSRRGGSQKGRLLSALIQECHVYPTYEEVEARYPRLIRALRWAGILSMSEARDCILGHLTTGSRYMGAESIANLGGAQLAIQLALKCRHAVGLRHA